MPAATGRAAKPEEAANERPALPGGIAFRVEQRPEVELLRLRAVAVGDRAPEEGMAHGGIGLAVVLVEGKQRGPQPAHPGVLLEKGLEGTERLHLPAACTVVPRAEQRPEVSLAGRRGSRVGQAALFERPIDPEQDLVLDLVDPVVVPALVAIERPQVPGLVDALDDRVGVDRRPAVDHALAAAALDEERPEQALLIVGVGPRAVRVTKERPDKRLRTITCAGGPGVERQDTQAQAGLRRGKIVLVPVEQGPEDKPVVIVPGVAVPAEQGPELEAIVARAGVDPHDGPRRVRHAPVTLLRLHVEGPGDETDAVVAEPVPDRPAEGKERLVRSGG